MSETLQRRLLLFFCGFHAIHVLAITLLVIVNGFSPLSYYFSLAMLVCTFRVYLIIEKGVAKSKDFSWRELLTQVGLVIWATFIFLCLALYSRAILIPAENRSLQTEWMLSLPAIIAIGGIVWLILHRREQQWL